MRMMMKMRKNESNNNNENMLTWNLAIVEDRVEEGEVAEDVQGDRAGDAGEVVGEDAVGAKGEEGSYGGF